ncbi:MAG: hypothetical protein DMF53_01115 [Acidobacteria bacterium]|nr:MAG: hypothetical protein DMF53_01115 [Acidobacteriota bacterium]
MLMITFAPCGQRRRTVPLAPSVLLAALWVLVAAGARAQSFSVLAGGLEDRDTAERSYTWSLDYQHPVYHGLGLGAAWINEGHLTNHHRDGLAGQLWLGTKFDRMSLAVGAGPYYYFDTTQQPGDRREVDSHGWGFVYSAALSWQLGHRWVHQLRVNRVASTDQPATTGILYGLGYTFRGDEGNQEDVEPLGYQFSALAGVTIANSFSSEKSVAKSVELRRTSGGQFEWTLAWLDEGTSGRLHRDGFSAQGWLARRWHEGNTTLAVGVGPYAIVDTFGEQRQKTRHLAGLASLSASQRFAAHWRGRISFSRVVGTHPFDSDVLLVGTSYAF